MPSSPAHPTESCRSGSALRGAALAFGCALAVGASVSCTNALARVALTQDLPALEAAVTRAEREGEIGRGELIDLAEAVLSREIVAQSGSTSFPETAACATHVRAALERAATSGGDAAGPASVALLEAGLPVPRAAKNPILAARRAVGASAGPRRRALFLNGDAAVRRAALRAAVVSADPADTVALLEVARLDPDVTAALIAIDALAVIGGPRVVLGLSDLWASAGVARRRAIIRAWAAPRTARAGGERELVRVAEREADAFAVLAALELTRMQPASRSLGEVTLMRLLSSDDTSTRLHAVYHAPSSSPPLRAALGQAARSEHAATRILGLLRAIELGAIDAGGILALRKLAAARDGGEGALARAVLARAGDRSVVAGLRADLTAPAAQWRTLAGLALFALEQWPAAAHAIADDSPSVRQQLSCHFLSAATRGDGKSAAQARARVFGPFAGDLVALLDSGSD